MFESGPNALQHDPAVYKQEDCESKKTGHYQHSDYETMDHWQVVHV